MNKKCKKAVRKAYHKGREKGFDHGFNVAKMLYNEIAVDLKRQIEELNSEIIVKISEEEDEDNGSDD